MQPPQVLQRPDEQTADGEARLWQQPAKFLATHGQRSPPPRPTSFGIVRRQHFRPAPARPPWHRARAAQPQNPKPLTRMKMEPIPGERMRLRQPSTTHRRCACSAGQGGQPLAFRSLWVPPESHGQPSPAAHPAAAAGAPACSHSSSCACRTCPCGRAWVCLRMRQDMLRKAAEVGLALQEKKKHANQHGGCHGKQCKLSSAHCPQSSPPPPDVRAVCCKQALCTSAGRAP